MNLGRFLVFVAVATTIVFGWHYYLWIRLVRDAALGPVWTRALTVVMWTMGILIPLGIAIARLAPRNVASPVMWVLYGWMGFAFILFFVLLPVDLVRAVVLRLHPVDAERRAFLARLVAGGVAALGAALAVRGLSNALQRVQLARVRVPLAKLPPALAGYTIVQLSDIHVGPTIGKEHVEQLVATANAQDADLVVITGDLVDGSVASLGHLVQPLRELRAKDGVYFVTGNHEYYSGVDEWLAFVADLGIRVLRNERVPLRPGLDLAGVDDTSARSYGHGHGQDVARALSGRDPTRAVVLLAHQPKAIFDAVMHDVDLQLSGHTHGGQIWPWGYFARLDQPHVAGLHDHDGTKIYVSCGSGYWGPPMRLGAPAEVTRLELTPA